MVIMHCMVNWRSQAIAMHCHTLPNVHHLFVDDEKPARHQEIHTLHLLAELLLLEILVIVAHL